MALFTAAVGLASSVGTWFTGLSIAAQIGVRIAAGLAFNALSRALAGRPDQKKQGIVGELQQGADVPRSFLFGRRATAGSLVYHNQWGGSENEFYTRVTALSDLPITDLDEIVVDGETYQIDRDNPHTDYGFPIIGLSETRTENQRELSDAGGRSGYIFTEVEVTDPLGWVKFYDGTQTTADSFLIDTVSTEDRPWTAQDVGTGVAYAITTFKFNRDTFQGLPKILFVCRGVPVRQSGGSANAYSENPIEMAAHLLRGISYGGRWFYGPQSPERVDDAEVAAEAAKCDQPVPGAQNMTTEQRIEAFGSDTIPARYRASLEVSIDKPVADIIEAILSACNGRASDAGTRYRLQVGDVPEPSFTLSDDDFDRDKTQSFAPFLPLAETVNGVTATYPDPGQAWELQDAPPIYRPDLEVLDDGRRLPTSVELSAVPFPEQVQRLMRSALAEARRARRISGTLPARFSKIEVGDVGTYNSTFFGGGEKSWRVDGIVDLQNGDLAIDLTEVDPSDYDFDAATDFTPVVPGSLAVRPPRNATVTNWQATSTTVSGNTGGGRRPALALTWDAPIQDVYSGLVWQVREATDGILVAEGVAGDPRIGVVLVSAGILPATNYEARGRFVFDGNSVWTAWTSVTAPDVRLKADDLDASINTAIIDAQAAADEARTRADAARLEIDRALPALPSLDEAVADIEEFLLAARLDLSTLEERVADAGVYVNPETGSVEITGVVAALEQVSSARLEVNALESQITQRVTFSDLTDFVFEDVELPELVDLRGRVSTAEQTLDAQEGTITQLTTTLTVDGGLVTMTEVQGQFDSVNSTLSEKLDRSEFDTVNADARLTAVEETTSAFDGATFTRSLQDRRILFGDFADQEEAALQGALTQFLESESLREASANAFEQVSARVSDDFVSQASRLEQIEVKVGEASADVVSESRARADADSAITSDLNSLTSRVGTAESGITSLAETKVDEQGAIAAINSEISAEFNDVQALATATSLAKSTADSLQAGFLWRARAGGAEGEVELVSDGVASQFRVSADRLIFDGGVAQFFTDTEINGNLIVTGSITAGEVEVGAFHRPTIVQDNTRRTITDETTWVNVCISVVQREAYPAYISYSTQVDGGGGNFQGNAASEAAILRTRLLRDGVVVGGVKTTTTGKYGHQVSLAWSETDESRATGRTVYIVQASKRELGTHYLHPRVFGQHLKIQQFRR